jgi:signal transduction histidine kinase/DNA-binding NarL/FixJ family response regulator
MYSGFSLTRRTAVEFFSESEDFSMNRSTLSSSKNRISIPISKAIDGFMKFKVAEGLSKRTIDSYEFYLNQWMEHVGDQDVAKVTASDLTNYIAWMRTEALILLVAFLPPALLTSINAMNIFRFMDRHESFVGFLMQYNQPIGLSLQAILFSLAIGNRYNRIKAERQRSKEESARLARLNDERKEFYATMSHELRTPLTIILGTNEQLRKGRYGDSIRKNAVHFSAIERNCLRLLRQVGAMLRLGTPASSIQADSLPVVATVGLILNDFYPVAAERRIALSWDPGTLPTDLCLRIAGEDLEALLMNLVSNALKYCPAGAQVRVEAALSAPGVTAAGAGVSLELSVADTGPGIPSAQQELIFERYRTASGAGGPFTTGLGLTLVRTIMKNYGGSVALRSREGEGSCFTLQFPASLVGRLSAGTPAPQGAGTGGRGMDTDAEKESPSSRLYTAELLAPGDRHPAHHLSGGSAAGAGAASAERKPRVLVVEDNDDMRAFIASVLDGRFDVLTASSGEEALATLEAGGADVIVSDVMMKGMDGHEFLSRLRARLQARHGEAPIPLIFLTARHSREEKIESLREGAIRYITKPFVPDELVAVIETILHHDRELAHSQVERIRKDMEHVLDRIDSQAQQPPRHPGPGEEALDAFFRNRDLSLRERDVVRCIISGMSDKEIASSLGISPRTVANHNRTIFRKTGVATKLELISKVLSGDMGE